MRSPLGRFQKGEQIGQFRFRELLLEARWHNGNRAGPHVHNVASGNPDFHARSGRENHFVGGIFL